jgi:hypothetical protein
MKTHGKPLVVRFSHNYEISMKSSNSIPLKPILRLCFYKPFTVIYKLSTNNFI